MAGKTSKTNKSQGDRRPASTMEELLANTGYQVKGFRSGEKIKAKIIEIGPKWVIFDVGGKSEGVLSEMYFQEAREYIKTLKVGDTVNATVMDPETSDGSVILSLRHASAEAIWERLEAARKESKELSVSVKNASASGVLVEYDGISGFIPTSHLGKKVLSELNELSGKRIQVKVVEIDKSRRKAVFSEKAVSEKENIELYEKAIKSLKDGEIYDGKITTVVDFGVFVAIPMTVDKKKVDVEGLVHLSELSWEKTEKGATGLKVGDKVSVKVLGDREGKLALSMKQAIADPWETIGNKYKVEDRVTGKVSRISDFGVFVQLESGIEGLIHMTKIPPAQKLKIGDEVNCNIEEIDTKQKKIALGLVLTAKPLGYK